MSELNPNELARQCAETMFANDACSQHLGLEIESVSPGEAVMTMRVQPWMLNGHGSIQGGILFTFADAAFAFACNGYNKVTIGQGCTIDYLKPAFNGEFLRARARELHRGGRTGTYDVVLENEAGETLALFRGRSYQVKGSILKEEHHD
ncbi:hydroxyphenylacetyl-CoA thioesterase PaaI [Oceanimonas doudoroffii]|uniref:Phenylacetic acid degradation protein PaaD n=1 Tax=Oceanimonas doudoroffii TaxID=84158 RepID=A0A233RHU8_9GAMM|nr:hydroxyphenylacetyl-CoA thioesterase PaaI [Oceanimonas doudoroffii]OXY82966.1 phenylacetic acid degradation protein PaaD [Oceanimonas doudoroffii]